MKALEDTHQSELVAYLWAAGAEFDAERFFHEHEDKGSLCRTKEMYGSRVVPGPTEWESDKIRVADQVSADEVIMLMLHCYGTIIDDAKKSGATEVIIQLVGGTEDMRLSPEIEARLASHGVSMDHDR